MRRYLAAALATTLLAALAACAPAGGSPSQAQLPSTAPCASVAPNAAPAPGCLPPGSAGASAGESAGPASSFETGPTGTPIGDWTVTLTGGPSAGTYSGRDEMTCVTVAGGPTSVAANPVGSQIGHIAMVTGSGADDLIIVSAGGIEGGGSYQNNPNPAVTVDGPTITNGILHLEMSGTQVLSDETRTLLLEATCPLFPAETDG